MRASPSIRSARERWAARDEALPSTAEIVGEVHAQRELMEEGYYNIFGRAGARTEVPGCSLCMGNQARVADNATVVSTSTRNFPNRLGNGADVYLASAELSAVAATLGRIPTMDEYLEGVKGIEPMSSDIYRYLNFHMLPEYQEVADEVKVELV